jgi:tetratricopeptide (TPR) repeat protein
MKFQRSSQNNNSAKSKAITETSALPILSQENLKNESETSISSSTPDAIDMKALKALVTKAGVDNNWSDVEKKEANKLLKKVQDCLDAGDLKKVELPLLKLLKLVTSFENECYELTWETCEILAKIYNRQDNHEKCLTMLSQSLSLKQQVLGENNSSYILTLIENANCLKRLGQTEDAEELFKEARELKTKSSS